MVGALKGRSTVASYHYTQKPVARSRGQSAVAGAAYRAGERLYDHSVDRTFDYSRRAGVAHAEIVLPTAAAQRDINWPRNRQALWNAAEKAEKRKDARIAREHEVALPHELNRSQQVALLRAFAVEIANRYNVAVDFALHKPHRKGDQRNFHAHVYSTTREITPTGLGAKALPELSDTDLFKRGHTPARVELKHMRARWEELQNEHLKAAGLEVRVDCRSLEAQGIDRVPTTHLGVAVSGMERRGIETEVSRRIAEQHVLEAQQRLERAAELGRIQREQHELTRSILDLSGDLAAAKRARELTRDHTLELSAPAPGMTAAERLRLKSDEIARRLAAEHEKERVLKQEHTQALERSKSLEHEREQEQEKHKGLDRGDDFELEP